MSFAIGWHFCRSGSVSAASGDNRVRDRYHTSPTAHHIAFPEQRYKGEPKVVISPEDSRQPGRKLSSLHDEAESIIMDEYRDSLYLRWA